jgi:hypothetical protein
MRGAEEKQIDAFSYVSIEDRISARHPIRPFKAMVNEILRITSIFFRTFVGGIQSGRRELRFQ